MDCNEEAVGNPPDQVTRSPLAGVGMGPGVQSLQAVQIKPIQPGAGDELAQQLRHDGRIA
jgi:hypothetical protein